MSSGGRMPQIEKAKGTGMIGFAQILGLLALLVSAGCGGSTGSAKNDNSGGGGGPAAATVVGTIAAGNGPRAVAVDSTTNTIYVANFGAEADTICQTCYCPLQNGTLTTIDGVTLSVATSALPPAGAQYPYENPMGLAVNPATNNVYIAARLFAQPNLTCLY